MDALGTPIPGIPQSRQMCWQPVQKELTGTLAEISGLPQTCQKLQNPSRDLELLWGSAQTKPYFVTGRQEGQMHIQNIFAGLFSLSFYLLREFWWMFHIHQPKHHHCTFPSVKALSRLGIFPDPSCHLHLWLHLSFAPSCQHPPKAWVRTAGLCWHELGH